jgi:hypothetical protein
MKQDMARSGMPPIVQQAIEQYVNRMADLMTRPLMAQPNGKKMSIEMNYSTSLGSTGVLVGLLLPAVQAAREAARRMSAASNIKQIMLALHNYHAVYNHLPAPAITDADGKPLLSWRVAILPFIEQQALHEQFHLDEPWDSEHNLPLAEKLPAIYVDPSVNLEPGLTIFQYVVGEDIGVKPEGHTSFRDIDDGLSNTILIAESNVDDAVVWTQPLDHEIDMENPLATMGNVHQGGFHVGLGDGAVKFITHSIDWELFRSLLTRAGGEVIKGF